MGLQLQTAGSYKLHVPERQSDKKLRERINIKKSYFKSKAFYITLALVLIASVGVCVIKFSASKKEDTPQAVQQQDICVAYSTDNNYVYPTIVSMTSLMENKNAGTFCKFTVLTSDSVTTESKEQIKSISSKYSGCSVNIVDMGQKFSDSEERFWSKAMYYRLNLPQILKDEKICIYLDGDTMVRHDISDMLSINMDDSYIAGVRDYNVIINKDSTYYKELGIPDLNSYVCSGVLIMNLEKIRNDNLNDAFDKIITKNDKEKTLRFPDQDTLNITCYGHILLLPFKYGALAHTDFTKPYKKSDYAQWASNQKDWDEGRKNPIVIHFTGDKPWSTIYSDFCKEWWKYADLTCCKKEIREKYKIS
jgi:lipopolysaccharide biosynthesis glycosyltransferase